MANARDTDFGLRHSRSAPACQNDIIPQGDPRRLCASPWKPAVHHGIGDQAGGRMTASPQEISRDSRPARWRPGVFFDGLRRARVPPVRGTRGQAGGGNRPTGVSRCTRTPDRFQGLPTSLSGGDREQPEDRRDGRGNQDRHRGADLHRAGAHLRRHRYRAAPNRVREDGGADRVLDPPVVSSSKEPPPRTAPPTGLGPGSHRSAHDS